MKNLIIIFCISLAAMVGCNKEEKSDLKPELTSSGSFNPKLILVINSVEYRDSSNSFTIHASVTNMLVMLHKYSNFHHASLGSPFIIAKTRNSMNPENHAVLGDPEHLSATINRTGDCTINVVCVSTKWYENIKYEPTKRLFNWSVRAFDVSNNSIGLVGVNGFVFW